MSASLTSVESAATADLLELRVILCPIDFSEFSARAYQHARSLAVHYGAKLVLQHIVEQWQYPCAGFAVSVDAYDKFFQSIHAKAMKELEEFAKANADNTILSELTVHDGTDVADSILSFAQSVEADVIVMGTHGRRGYDRLMLGSVTDRVMRNSSCPVLAVCRPKPESLADNGPNHIHHLSRILFCTDFSENSDRALQYALFVVAEYDAELTLLHVLEEVGSPAHMEHAKVRATEQLDQLIPPKRRKDLKTKTAVRVGKPYGEIIQFAREEGSDLVVMGVRGRGALDLAVFGSSTYRVIQLGPCPVLVHA